MHRNKFKNISLVLAITTIFGLVGCQKQEKIDNVDNKNIKTNNLDNENIKKEKKYSKQDLENEYREYLKCLTLLTHEIPLDTYTILGYNNTKTKYSEFKQNQLISFDVINDLIDLSKNAKISEIKKLAQLLLKESENTQYKLVEVANKQEVINTIEEIKPIINEYTKVLTTNLAKIEFDTIIPLLLKNELTEIKEQFNKEKSKIFKEKRDTYIDKLEYLYGDRTKKVLNNMYDNL